MASKKNLLSWYNMNKNMKMSNSNKFWLKWEKTRLLIKRMKHITLITALILCMINAGAQDTCENVAYVPKTQPTHLTHLIIDSAFRDYNKHITFPVDYNELIGANEPALTPILQRHTKNDTWQSATLHTGDTILQYDHNRERKIIIAKPHSIPITKWKRTNVKKDSTWYFLTSYKVYVNK